MYYAPWSTHSVAVAHPFSMASRLIEGKYYMSYATINCWTVVGTCLQSYRITTFLMVVAYSNNVSLIKNGFDLRTMRSRYQHFVVEYFIFKNKKTLLLPSVPTGVACLLNSGSTNDHSIVVRLLTSLKIARELGVRFEGDIHLFRATESKLVWPGQGAKRTAEGIASWVRTQRDVTANVQWINLRSVGYRNRTAREHFSVMEGNFTQKSLRSFICRYHKYSNSDHLLDENMTKSKFRPANESKLWTGPERTKEKQTLGRLDQHSIMQLIEAKILSSDHIVFFSGGNWHAPSTAVLHVMHTVARYFDESTSTIKFHVIDTSRYEMPYNFNFERLPALVLFLSDRLDVSWKYPDSLPVSVSNLLSFVLSRCSSNLR